MGGASRSRRAISAAISAASRRMNGGCLRAVVELLVLEEREDDHDDEHRDDHLPWRERE